MRTSQPKPKSRATLVAMQLRGLLRDSSNARAVTAGERLLARFAHEHAADGSEALRQNAHVLIDTLLPGVVPMAAWDAHVSLDLRVALGPYAAAFDALRAQIRRQTPSGPQASASALPPSMPADISSDPAGAQTRRVLTITGATRPAAGLAPQLVVMNCDEAGAYPEAAWAQASRPLQLVAPLLVHDANRAHVVARILRGPCVSAEPWTNVYVSVIKSTQLAPQLKQAIASALVQLQCADLDGFVSVCAAAFAPFLYDARMPQAVRVLSQLHANSTMALLLAGKQGAMKAQWVGAVCIALTQIPHNSYLRSAKALSLANLAGHVLPCSPETVQQIMGVLDRDAQDALGLTNAAKLMLGGTSAPVPTFLGILDILLPLTSRQRYTMASALGRYRPFAWPYDTLAVFARCIAGMEENAFRHFVNQLGGIVLYDVALLDSNRLNAVVTALAFLTAEQRDTVLDVFASFGADDLEFNARAYMLTATASFGDAVLGVLQDFALQLPGQVTYDCIEVLCRIEPSKREVVLRAARRLVPQDVSLVLVNPIFLAPALYILSTLENIQREHAVTHMEAVGVDLCWNGPQLRELVSLLAKHSSDECALRLRAYRRLDHPDLPPQCRSYLMMVLGHLPADDVVEFVQACRLMGQWSELSARRAFGIITHMAHRFAVGRRPDPHAVRDSQSVHNASYNQSANRSIAALRGMRALPMVHAQFVKAIRDLIAVSEADLPQNHPDRQVQPGRTRSLFNDARHALEGVDDGVNNDDDSDTEDEDGEMYDSFAQNREMFPVQGAQPVRVGDLANMIWQAILRYPEDAENPPASAEAIEADKIAMTRNFIVQLADCVEGGKRVCYAGKTMRILAAVQGYVKAVGVDDFKALFEAANEPFEGLPPGTLLQMRSEPFMNDYDEPTLDEIERFVAGAVAAGQQQWSELRSDARKQYMSQLKEYVALSYEAFDEAYPEFWQAFGL